MGSQGQNNWGEEGFHTVATKSNKAGGEKHPLFFPLHRSPLSLSCAGRAAMAASDEKR